VPNTAAGPSPAGPSAAAATADDSDEDDLLVTDEKTEDELYEVCPSQQRYSASLSCGFAASTLHGHAACCAFTELFSSGSTAAARV